MSQPWEPEVVVDAALAAELVDEQCPALAPARVAPFGVGWDNTAYRVNDAWVFRFPRRTVAVPLLETETRVLPAVHARLPLPVPNPEQGGRASPRFPWPFAGYRHLPGRTACSFDLDDRARAGLAAPLGRFLAALHAIGEAEARVLGAGDDTWRRMDLAWRMPRAREALAKARARGLIEDIAPLLAVVDEVAATKPPPALSLVHGDLYARHVLLDESARACGVIDWGDTHVGEPALDLAIAWMLLPAEARPAFSGAYGGIDDDAWKRARFRAVYHQANTVLYADEVGDEALRRACLASLRHAGRP